ncbi:Hypothetical predicted protein, partial [Marmota monax]
SLDQNPSAGRRRTRKLGRYETFGIRQPLLRGEGPAPGALFSRSRSTGPQILDLRLYSDPGPAPRRAPGV